MMVARQVGRTTKSHGHSTVQNTWRVVTVLSARLGWFAPNHHLSSTAWLHCLDDTSTLCLSTLRPETTHKGLGIRWLRPLHIKTLAHDA